MGKKTEEKLVLPPVDQLGIVVKDAEKTAKHYSSLFSMGPFRVYDVSIDKSILYDKPAAPSKVKIAIAQMGPIEIELIQVLEGGEVYSDFLRNQREGIHHLGIHINDFDDYERLVAEFPNQGISPFFSYKGSRLCFTYLHTQNIGGVILELIHLANR
jgi:methylmalonyl-CoA/ethylmalonyl-CoA epimerase